jgi:Fur family ferric uptake transcriptional regulator
MSQPRGTRVRATKQAAVIVEAMGRMPGFSGARGIYDALRETGEQVGIATVYRHLRVLAEHGDVDMIQADRGETRYRLRADGATCYLSCRACGESVPVDASEVRAWAEGLAAETGFTLTGYTAHLTGLCRTSCETGRLAAAAAAAAGPGPGDAGRGSAPPGPGPEQFGTV